MVEEDTKGQGLLLCDYILGTELRNSPSPEAWRTSFVPASILIVDSPHGILISLQPTLFIVPETRRYLIYLIQDVVIYKFQEPVLLVVWGCADLVTA